MTTTKTIMDLTVIKRVIVNSFSNNVLTVHTSLLYALTLIVQNKNNVEAQMLEHKLKMYSVKASG